MSKKDVRSTMRMEQEYISDIGEFAFIDLIKNDTINRPKRVIYSIGDDCAVYKADSNKDQIITTDMMVEDVHFSKETITAYQLGYRLGAANLSDIAAMGGTPLEAVISIALPHYTSVFFCKEFYKGIKKIFKRYKVNLIGGDTVSSPSKMVINLTVIGEVPSGKAIYRHGSKVDDIVFVTNTVGSSAAGLYALQHEIADYRAIKRAHLMPEPQVKIGKSLLKSGAHALNDISDGLSSELNEIAQASHVIMEIDESAIPLHKQTLKLAKEIGESPYHFAWYGGEDFQLVGTMNEDDFEACKARPHLTPIGRVVGKVKKGEAGIVRVKTIAGETSIMNARGYNHFYK